MSFCPTCPRDDRGHLRELIEANGTKCSCGYELPSCPTEFLRISAKEHTDDRRNKTYNRKVVVIFTDPRSAALRAQAELCRCLDPKPSNVGTYDPNPRWPSPKDGFEPHQIRLTFTLTAERPSLIASEGEAISEYRATLGTLTEQINTVIGELEAEDNSKANCERTAKQATRLAEWISGEAKERALDLTRFEQRLAGLKAELEAEIATQLKKFEPEEGIVKHNTEHADDQFTDEELTIAKAHAGEFAHHLAGIFPRNSPVITPEQVAEHRGEKESRP